MFDAEQRVVTCNSRYAQMYGLTMEQVQPGTTLQEIIQLRVANGLYADGGPDEYMRERVAPIAGAVQHHPRAERRPLDCHSPPADAGGGWVTTHEDITEHRRREARIAHMAHHDALTDLPNRVLVNEKLELALARARQGRDCRLPSARPRRLQEHQRHARSSGRRQAAAQGRRPPAHAGARYRHHRPHGRRRVRHPADAASPSRRMRLPSPSASSRR